GLRIKKTASPYSPAQIIQWLKVIGYPGISQLTSLDNFPVNIDILTTLTLLHTVTFPFENTQMHYTASHLAKTDPEDVFQRLVVERKGATCSGQNPLFMGMLRAYTVASRCDQNYGKPTSTSGYTPPSHIVLLVQPSLDDRITHLVDVGFGGPGPARPILLSDSPDNIVMGTTPTQWHRV
ncbi:hypothetical protein C8J56DRAFT_720745, partial [Mycena floridula]